MPFQITWGYAARPENTMERIWQMDSVVFLTDLFYGYESPVPLTPRHSVACGRHDKPVRSGWWFQIQCSTLWSPPVRIAFHCMENLHTRLKKICVDGSLRFSLT